MKNMKKLDKYLLFTIFVIILSTIVYTILQTINPEIDYHSYYVSFIGVFGAPELFSCLIIKCFNIKKENDQC